MLVCGLFLVHNIVCNNNCFQFCCAIFPRFFSIKSYYFFCLHFIEPITRKMIRNANNDGNIFTAPPDVYDDSKFVAAPIKKGKWVIPGQFNLCLTPYHLRF